MPDGKPQPVLTLKSVEAALDTLIYTTTDTSAAQPLQALALVDDFLENRFIPPASIAREYALKSTLTTLITGELKKLRTVFNLPVLLDDAPLEEVSRAIVLDGQQDSWELLVWSFLYAHYVRADLNLSLKKYCRLAAVDLRTLFRHRRTTLENLTERLIQAECETRIRQHQRRLLADIPLTDKITLEGRDAELRQVHAVLQQKHSCIYIYGAPGTGKTRLVCDIVRRLMRDSAVDVLIWIDSPRSIASVYAQLKRRLVPHGSAISAREMMLSLFCVIVLDSIETLHDPEAAAWNDLLNYLNHATVFITGQVYYPSAGDCVPVRLNNLDEPAAHRLMDSLAQHFRRDDATGLEDIAAFAWEYTGGNPAAIKLVFAQFEQDKNAFLTSDILDTLYERVYDRLPPDQQTLWQLLALLPSGLPVWEIVSLHPAFEKAMQALVRQALVEYEANGCILLHTAAAYIEQRWRQETEFQGSLATHLKSLLLETESDNRGWLAEAVLSSLWLRMDNTTALMMMRRWWRSGLAHGLASNWSDIFQRYVADFETAPDLLPAYAVCLRKSGNLAEADTILQRLLEDSGRAGEFGVQAEVLVEYAISLRMRGEYQKALEMLAKADEAARRYQNQALLQRIMQEFAGIAIDTEDIHLANEYLDRLRETPVSRLLLMELYYLAEQYDHCRRLGETITGSRDADLLDRAAVHTIIGRSYQAETQISAAFVQFENAVNLYDRAGDIFAFARSQTNLAALCIETGQYDQAETLLESALMMQTRLRDSVGLNATRANLNHLRRRLDTDLPGNKKRHEQ